MKIKNNRATFIVLFVVIVLFVSVGGYVVYSKYMKNNADEKNQEDDNTQKHVDLNPELKNLNYFSVKQASFDATANKGTYDLIAVTNDNKEIVIYPNINNSFCKNNFDYFENKIYLVLNVQCTYEVKEYEFLYINLNDGNGNYKTNYLAKYQPYESDIDAWYEIKSIAVTSTDIYFSYGHNIKKYSLETNDFLSVVDNMSFSDSFLNASKDRTDNVIYEKTIWDSFGTRTGNILYLLDKSNKSIMIDNYSQTRNNNNNFIHSNKIVYTDLNHCVYEYNINLQKKKRISNELCNPILVFTYEDDYLIFSHDNETTNELKIFSFNTNNINIAFDLKLQKEEFFDFDIIRLSENEFYFEIYTWQGVSPCGDNCSTDPDISRAYVYNVKSKTYKEVQRDTSWGFKIFYIF